MENGSARKFRIRRIALVVVAVAVVLLVSVVPFGISAYVYESNFGSRLQSAAFMERTADEFPGLSVREASFASDQGQTLASYLFTHADAGMDESGAGAKGVVVIAHGLGGGCNSYMDVADRFARSGYAVFAYDGTGNDRSEGDAVGGLPQAVIDLGHALDTVEQSDELGDLPIMLFGHSWGGYAVGSVLVDHPEVSAVVSVAGFDTSAAMLESEGRQMAGDAINLLLPYLSLYEHLKFGAYADSSAVQGFASSSAHVLVLHSANDGTVPPATGVERYRAAFGDDPRFTFVEFEDRGHSFLYYSDEARANIDAFNEAYYAYWDANDGANNADLMNAWRAEHMDKQACFILDEDLMSSIVAFYDESAAR
ncbi:alpha/beta hydrolase family protein [Eggerthella sinensis]|uniref:alpha/beta hydrolase family protein n=2 Tax=Eggerthella TaxID=84111 RepID=UPI00248EF377|nr:alpha/beta fold hydrolase [Eggerthella sinensis]